VKRLPPPDRTTAGYSQCGQTSYQLIKTYMGKFKAGLSNAIATLFGASLKKEYDPEDDDRLTERCILLIESGQM
jgi:hypothetical protein